MTAFYNEIDAYAAQYLRNLIAAGHIAPGVVDERPIKEIEPYELLGYTQCHFFAGIGIWSHALRRAGWSDDRPIWTGSAPCQPFSAAGQQKGFNDDRHQWPNWKNLIDVCKPSVVVGEQVASALGWLDLVQTDLEGAGYAFGANDLSAAGFGGAHIRQRLYFVGLACADDAGLERHRKPGQFDAAQRWENEARHGSENSALSGMADAGREPVQSRIESRNDAGATGQIEREAREFERSRAGDSDGGFIGYADAPLLGREAVDWLFCRDGKWRPVEAGTFPLVNEDSGRVGKLRAYGNALDAETATQFCSVVREICDEIGV